MNAKEFERLPILLSRSQVISAGITRRAMHTLIQGGQLVAIKLRPEGRNKYLKASVAKLVGL